MRKNSLLLIIIVMCTSFVLCSFSVISNKATDEECSLTVYKKSGAVAKSMKVTTDVSGGISCSGHRSFTTDSNGEVTLKWSSGCYLKHVFIDDNGYDVDYRNGRSYKITLK